MELVEPIRDKRKIESIKRYLRGKNLRDYALFVLGINSGLKVEDLLTLKVKNVLDDKGKIKDFILIFDDKLTKMKEFSVPKTAQSALDEYLRTRPTLGDEEPLFRSKNGGFLSRIQAWRVISEAGKAVGIEGKIGTHTLRKTFGYHAYVSGIDIKIIQFILGHPTPSMTLRYIGVTPDQKTSRVDLRL